MLSSGRCLIVFARCAQESRETKHTSRDRSILGAAAGSFMRHIEAFGKSKFQKHQNLQLSPASSMVFDHPCRGKRRRHGCLVTANSFHNGRLKATRRDPFDLTTSILNFGGAPKTNDMDKGHGSKCAKVSSELQYNVLERFIDSGVCFLMFFF